MGPAGSHWRLLIFLSTLRTHSCLACMSLTIIWPLLILAAIIVYSCSMSTTSNSTSTSMLSQRAVPLGSNNPFITPCDNLSHLAASFQQGRQQHHTYMKIPPFPSMDLSSLDEEPSPPYRLAPPPHTHIHPPGTCWATHWLGWWWHSCERKNNGRSPHMACKSALIVLAGVVSWAHKLAGNGSARCLPTWHPQMPRQMNWPDEQL